MHTTAVLLAVVGTIAFAGAFHIPCNIHIGVQKCSATKDGAGSQQPESADNLVSNATKQHLESGRLRQSRVLREFSDEFRAMLREELAPMRSIESSIDSSLDSLNSKFSLLCILITVVGALTSKGSAIVAAGLAYIAKLLPAAL